MANLSARTITEVGAARLQDWKKARAMGREILRVPAQYGHCHCLKLANLPRNTWQPALWVAFLLAILPNPATAQVAPWDTFATRSHSGQFIIRGGGSSRSSRSALALSTNLSFVCLDPTLLSVSCERIKQSLLRELQTGTSWRGRIFLVLFPASSGNEPVTITSERFRDGWQYRVDLPEVVERTRYVQAIVQVVLLEIANRSAETRPAELPPWLVAGLAKQLLASSEAEIILPPPRANVNGLSLAATFINARKGNPIEQAHQQLRANPPLTFEQLSWPPDDRLSGSGSEVYRSSAQLFVSELLNLQEGRASLRSMLVELPRYYNWQLAFLHAFRAYFQRPLDVEKWWALHLAHFSGHDLAQTWSEEESWQKLAQMLNSSVQVRTSSNEMPFRTEVTLQTIIRDWEPAARNQALQNKLRELEMLRLRVARDLAGLVDEYRQTLEAYLLNNRNLQPTSVQGNVANLSRAAEETLKRLDELDVQRQAQRH